MLIHLNLLPLKLVIIAPTLYSLLLFITDVVVTIAWKYLTFFFSLKQEINKSTSRYYFPKQ